MATAWISTNTELSLVNTITQNLTLFLPQAPPNGKSLFIKDAAGNSTRSTITIRTQGSDSFEDGSLFQTLNSSYESIQLNYNSNIWYFTGGMMFNTFRVSTLQANLTQTRNLSTGNVSISSFQLTDIRTSTVGTFNSFSSFLYYNGFNIGGGFRTAIPQTLNNYRFTPQQVPALSLWLDGADSNTITLNGSNISQWNDKSGLNTLVNQTTVSAQPLYSTNGLVIDTSSKFMRVNNLSLFTNIPYASLFIAFNVVSTIATQPNYVFWSDGSITSAQRFASYVNRAAGPITGTFARAGDVGGVATADGGTFYSTNQINLLNSEVNFAGNSLNNILNGTIDRTTALGSSFNSAPTNSQTITIGLQGSANAISTIIHEMLLYKPQRPLTILQRQQIEGYLAWKWNFQSNLPANHPFRNAPP